MGGFTEYDGNHPIRVLLSNQLDSYSLTGNGDFPRISKKEIQDKSKGDFISKAVVILQTSWFVMQCIARGVRGLPITELELATIAFASLNLVIYLLWWDKPLNVECGVRVYKKRITDSPVDDGHVEPTVGFWVALEDELSKLPAAIVDGPSLQESNWDKWPWLIRVLIWPVLTPFSIILGGGNDTVDEKRVATFYPRLWSGEDEIEILALFLVAAIASAFGGIHCIGWSFTFPSSTERMLWRVTSFSITSAPILVTIAWRLFTLLSDRHWSVGIIDMFLLFLGGLQLFLYVLSRLVLLVLCFLCLRSLPPTAYYAVHWTSFIPHV